MIETVKVSVTVRLAYPVERIGKRALRAHIRDAILSWGGGLCPDDLLFDGVRGASVGPVEVLAPKGKDQ